MHFSKHFHTFLQAISCEDGVRVVDHIGAEVYQLFRIIIALFLQLVCEYQVFAPEVAGKCLPWKHIFFTNLWELIIKFCSEINISLLPIHSKLLATI